VVAWVLLLVSGDVEVEAVSGGTIEGDCVGSMMTVLVLVSKSAQTSFAPAGEACNEGPSRWRPT
jgi:hypothetical protein